MAVLLETSLGEFTIDLRVDEAPIACKNFLKLCKIKYYNGCLFYNVQQGLLAQTGDPTGTGKGGTSVYGLCYGNQAKYFEDEVQQNVKHDKKGLVCMANNGTADTNGSQFFVTLRGEDLEHLDGKHTIFGEVAEGMEVLDALNTEFVDPKGRPFRDVRILHTTLLEDPYEDPRGLEEPPASPVGDQPPAQETVLPRLSVVEDPSEALRTVEEIEEELQVKEARSRATVLEMLGDLPDAEARAPENALFIAKLNPVTRDEDLELIFSRFGKIVECNIVRDYVTGDSLNYAFIEFKELKACEEAYRKMDGVLIDDRRIKVDFSQSVSKLWNRFAEKPRGNPNGKPNGNGSSHGSKTDPGHYSAKPPSDEKEPAAAAAALRPPPPPQPPHSSQTANRDSSGSGSRSVAGAGGGGNSSSRPRDRDHRQRRYSRSPPRDGDKEDRGQSGRQEYRGDGDGNKDKDANSGRGRGSGKGSDRDDDKDDDRQRRKRKSSRSSERRQSHQSDHRHRHH